MAQTDIKVKRIIRYIQAKIANLQKKKAEYDSPIIQEQARNSPHYQAEYNRICIELQVNEDNLLAIETFSEGTEKKTEKPLKAKKVSTKKEDTDAKKEN